MSVPTTLRVTFNPTSVRPNEQPSIITICTTAWRQEQALRPSRGATVYSIRGAWWHANANDPEEHITVWYDSRANFSRVHIYYQNGQVRVNLRPDRPPVRVSRAIALSAEPSTAEAVEGEEGYDTVPELSDEEWSKEDES